MKRTSKPGIYKRGDSYTIVLPYVDSSGRRKQKWLSGFKTLVEAEKEKTRLRHLRDTGLEISPERMTVSAYAKRWLAHKESRVRPNTYISYVDAFKRVEPIIGAIQLSVLRPAHVQESLDKLTAEGLAPSTVNKTRAVLSSAFLQAVAWDLIPRNPGKVEGPRPRKREVLMPSKTELTRLCQAADEEGIGPLVRLALRTGCRISELLALQWADVDLEVRRIRIRASKTDAGVRSFSVGPDTITLLRGLRQESGIHRLSGQVINLTRNQTIWPWRKAREKAGLPMLHFHDLRHIHVSELIELGVDFKVIQERIGHTSIKTTLDLYGHLRPVRDEEAALKLDKAMEGM